MSNAAQGHKTKLPIPLHNDQGTDKPYGSAYATFSNTNTNKTEFDGTSGQQKNRSYRRHMNSSAFLAQLAHQYERAQTLRSEKADRRRRAVSSYQVKATHKLQETSLGTQHDLKT